MQKIRKPSLLPTTAALALAGLFLAPPAGAQEAAGPVQRAAGQRAVQSPRPEGDETKQLKRLLYLRGGGVVRGKCHLTDDGWVVQRGRAEQLVPTSAVERVVRERDVLQAARKRARGVDAKDLKGRAEHAGWLVEQGLVAEAVDELDKVLGFDPELEAAHQVLDTGAIRIAMPQLGEGSDEELEEVLRFGAGAGPVARELAVEELKRYEDREALSNRLRDQLFVSSPNHRDFATLALRRLFPGEHLKELIHRAVLDPADRVRHSAGVALHVADEPAVVVPVLRALSSGHQTVRTQAAEALGYMDYPEAVEPMVKALSAYSSAQSSGAFPAPGAYIFTGRQRAYIQDFDVEVAQFQAVADPQVNVLIEGEVLHTRIQGVTARGFAVERANLRRSLARIVGEDAGNSTRSWEQWWEENRHKWVRDKTTRVSVDD